MTTVTGDLAIRVRGLRKVYGNTPAVDGIDLDVYQGEIFSMLGPNGAGKTTTVEILEGFRPRSAGDVEVLGVDPAVEGPEWKARLGLVLQNSKLPDEITVAEIISHFTHYYPHPRTVDEVIELVGLQEKRTSRISRLSGGQQRRVEVGLGIINRPELLFLDEPTTGFDPQARRQFWELIEQLRSEGTTILLTTHYLDEAEALADRVGVIAKGRIIAIGPPATLGGRATAAARVRWLGANGIEEIVTDEPAKAVLELATRFDGEIPELTVTRPSLEDIYLEMIGAETVGAEP